MSQYKSFLWWYKLSKVRWKLHKSKQNRKDANQMQYLHEMLPRPRPKLDLIASKTKQNRRNFKRQELVFSRPLFNQNIREWKWPLKKGALCNAHVSSIMS